MSIGYKTPSEVHLEQGEQKKMWKNKIYHKKESDCEKDCLPLQGQTEQPGFCVSSKTNMSRISVRHLRLCLLIQYGFCRTVYCYRL